MPVRPPFIVHLSSSTFHRPHFIIMSHRILCWFCKKSISAPNIRRHIRDSCENKNEIRPCPNCGNDITVHEYHIHQNECPSKNRISCSMCERRIHPKGMSRHKNICDRERRITPEATIVVDFSRNPEYKTLIRSIKNLQGTGHFPECELENNLRPLLTGKKLDWREPTVINPKECWNHEFPPEEIFHSIWSTVQSSDSNFNVLRGGEIIEDLNEKKKAISNVLYQAIEPFEGSDTRSRYSLMNVLLPKEFCQLNPNLALKAQLRLAPSELSLGANFAPAGNFVDLHIDQNRHALSQSLGSSCRIWLLYPPTENNLSIFTRFSGESVRLAKISKQLEGGYVTKIDSSKILYIPPAWIHATFTTSSGGLVGINFESLEGLKAMAQSLAAHSKYMFRIKDDFNEDLAIYKETIETFLSNEYADDIISVVLESWIIFASSMQVLINSRMLDAWCQENLQQWQQVFIEVWKRGTSKKISSCCGNTFKDLYQHIRAKHLWKKITSK